MQAMLMRVAVPFCFCLRLCSSAALTASDVAALSDGKVNKTTRPLTRRADKNKRHELTDFTITSGGDTTEMAEVMDSLLATDATKPTRPLVRKAHKKTNGVVQDVVVESDGDAALMEMSRKAVDEALSRKDEKIVTRPLTRRVPKGSTKVIERKQKYDENGYYVHPDSLLPKSSGFVTNTKIKGVMSRIMSLLEVRSSVKEVSASGEVLEKEAKSVIRRASKKQKGALRDEEVSASGEVLE